MAKSAEITRGIFGGPVAKIEPATVLRKRIVGSCMQVSLPLVRANKIDALSALAIQPQRLNANTRDAPCKFAI